MKSPISLLCLTGLTFALLGTPALPQTITLTPASPNPTIVNTKACAHPSIDATLSASRTENPSGSEYSAIPGVSVLLIDLDAQGKLTSESLTQTSGSPWLDRAAMRSAQESIFTPKISNCSPVASAYFYQVEF